MPSSQKYLQIAAVSKIGPSGVLITGACGRGPRIPLVGEETRRRGGPRGKGSSLCPRVTGGGPPGGHRRRGHPRTVGATDRARRRRIPRRSGEGGCREGRGPPVGGKTGPAEFDGRESEYTPEAHLAGRVHLEEPGSLVGDAHPERTHIQSHPSCIRRGGRHGIEIHGSLSNPLWRRTRVFVPFSGDPAASLTLRRDDAAEHQPRANAPNLDAFRHRDFRSDV